MRTLTTFILLIAFFSFDGFCADKDEAAKKKEMIYVGTFSENGSLGIYVYSLDRKNIRYDLQQTIFSKGSPSFIDISPNGKFLFSANREGLGDKEEWGSVTSFAIDQSNNNLFCTIFQHIKKIN